MQPDFPKYNRTLTVASQNNENQPNVQRGNCDAQSCGNLGLLSANEQNDPVSVNMKGSSAKVQLDVGTWIETEAPKRVNSFFTKIGIDKALIQKEKRSELLQQIDNMSPLQLSKEKKYLRFQLEKYNKDFELQFDRDPSYDQKYPIKELYLYYRILKQAIAKKGKQQMIVNEDIAKSC